MSSNQSIQQVETRSQETGVPFVPAIYDDYPLNPFERAMFDHVCRRAGGVDGKGCNESIPNMARRTRMSLSRARVALRSLESLGMLLKVSPAKDGGTFTYFPRAHENWVHPEVAEARATPVKSERGSKSDTTIETDTPTRSDRGVVSDLIPPPIRSDTTPLSDLVDKGIDLKVLPLRYSSEGYELTHDKTSCSDREEDSLEKTEDPIQLTNPSAPLLNQAEATEHPTGVAEDKGSAAPRKGRKKRELPAESAHAPGVCQGLWQRWSVMYIQYRGEYDSRKQFVAGFDWLVEQGHSVDKIEAATQFYCDEKERAIVEGRKGQVKLPPDGIRFFKGKDGGESYCLRAWELMQAKQNNQLATPPPMREADRRAMETYNAIGEALAMVRREREEGKHD